MTTTATDTRAFLDSLASAHGVELRIDHDEEAPMPYSVWCWCPESETELDADLIGAGESESEVVDEARKSGPAEDVKAYFDGMLTMAELQRRWGKQT